MVIRSLIITNSIIFISVLEKKIDVKPLIAFRATSANKAEKIWHQNNGQFNGQNNRGPNRRPVEDNLDPGNVLFCTSILMS